MDKHKKLLVEMLKSLGYAYGYSDPTSHSIFPCRQCKRQFKDEAIAIDYVAENIWEYYCLTCVGISLGGSDENEKAPCFSTGTRTRRAAQAVQVVPRWGERPPVGKGR